MRRREQLARRVAALVRVVAALLEQNPLRARAIVAMLPAKGDKVAGARARWRFTREQVHALTTDARIAPDRRAINAVLLWTGMRPQEFRAMRVTDVDFAAQPLGCITIARAIKSGTGAEAEMKTGAIKDVLMVPALAAALRAWLEGGWRAAMGRDPQPGDLVFPSVRGRKKGQPRNQSTANRTFRED